MIRICDAIMGSGKSSAAITYMNEHPDKKFVYLSPYNNEDTRICDACPALHFVEPDTKHPKSNHTKTSHTNILIREGRNVASTHQAFKFYTSETIDAIKAGGYTLIIDESLSVIELAKHANDADITLLERAGMVNLDGEVVTASDEEYKGVVYHELFRILDSRELYRLHESPKDKRRFYWLLPKDLLEAFSDVYILTYLYEAQDLYYYMKMRNMTFKYIGVTHRNGVYRFSETEMDTPDYVRSIRDKIHILDNKKLNSIGDNKHALSMNWFNTNPEKVKQLRNNILNYFSHLTPDIPHSERLWGTYSEKMNALKGPGYTKGFLVFNSRATNEYRDRRALAYAVNIFCNSVQRGYLFQQGIQVDEDAYALSMMVQWIWRSAIREGNDIWLYLPSSRMRRILNEWLDNLSDGVTVMHSVGDVVA